MIHVDFTLAVALYTTFLLAAIFAVWIFARKQKEKDLSLDPRFIWFCSVCAYTFINTKEEYISICPRCGSYNKKSS